MKPKLLLRLALSFGLGLAQRTASAESHDLFHPVPEAEMRELTTDRPDKTESAITVDAGHFQIEVDLASWHRDQDAFSRATVLGLGVFNAKVGLTDYADLQLGFESYNMQNVEDLVLGGESKVSGNGDFVGRLKVNLWGDNGGATNFGVMPFIKIPTAAPGLANTATEGGMILPLGFDLGAGFNLGTMAEFDFSQNAADSGYHTDTVLSASLSHDLFGNLGFYLEYWCQLSGETAVPNQQTVDGGLTLGLGKNAQLDIGVNAGTDPAAEDLNPFFGLSLRI